jgi:hypothetical protein
MIQLGRGFSAGTVGKMNSKALLAIALAAAIAGPAWSQDDSVDPYSRADPYGRVTPFARTNPYARFDPYAPVDAHAPSDPYAAVDPYASKDPDATDSSTDLSAALRDYDAKRAANSDDADPDSDPYGLGVPSGRKANAHRRASDKSDPYGLGVPPGEQTDLNGSATDPDSDPYGLGVPTGRRTDVNAGSTRPDKDPYGLGVPSGHANDPKGSAATPYGQEDKWTTELGTGSDLSSAKDPYAVQPDHHVDRPGSGYDGGTSNKDYDQILRGSVSKTFPAPGQTYGGGPAMKPGAGSLSSSGASATPDPNAHLSGMLGFNPYDAKTLLPPAAGFAAKNRLPSLESPSTGLTMPDLSPPMTSQ